MTMISCLCSAAGDQNGGARNQAVSRQLLDRKNYSYSLSRAHPAYVHTPPKYSLSLLHHFQKLQLYNYKIKYYILNYAINL